MSPKGVLQRKQSEVDMEVKLQFLSEGLIVPDL